MDKEEYKRLRKQIGTQAEVARKLGISPKQIGERERGKATLRPEFFLALQRIIDKK